MSSIEEKSYQSQKINFGTWRKLFAFAAVRKKHIYLVLGCGMLTGILDLCNSLISMWAIDSFITPGTLEVFPLYIAAALAAQILFAAFTYGYGTGAGRLEAHITADVRASAFTKLQTMSFSYFDRSSVGYLLARLTNDVSRTVETLSWSMIDVGWGAMAILACMIGMFAVNWRLALILFVSLPILVAVSVFFQKRILRLQRETRRLNSMITSSFNEGIMGAKTTKTLVREELNNRDFFALTGKMRRASTRAAMISGLYMPTASLIISAAVAWVLVRGGRGVTLGFTTVGQLNFFIGIGNMMFEPIRQFANIFAELQSCQAAAERVAEVLDSEPDIVDAPEAEEKYGGVFDAKRENWETVVGEVEFQDVTFRYKEGETVLERFNLKVRAGENVALVGETGGGKSTIVNLVCRFYEPQEGRVLIDGRDIKERSQLWLQSSLGYVLQSPHLFSGTVRENIRYGRLDATDGEIEAAAREVGAHEFISALERGYETEVGEGGSLLSTGQKQLISFARAIIANPKIIVLDEATSSIDTESEMKIEAARERLLKGHTSFIIAHRLSTIRNADRILVIAGGKILEEGSHRELMRKKRHYHELYTNQFKTEKIEESVSLL